MRGVSVRVASLGVLVVIVFVVGLAINFRTAKTDISDPLVAEETMAIKRDASSNKFAAAEHVDGDHEVAVKECPQTMPAKQFSSREVTAARRPIDLDQYKVLWLHPGKSGGGTFQSRLQSSWYIHAPKNRCHPHPCPDRAFAQVQKSSNNDTASSKTSNTASSITTIINIRDPIDRFVSAFHWRRLVLCNPQGDERERDVHNKATQNPTKYCKQPEDPTEQAVIFQTYQQNVTTLAEALCTAQGQQDIRAIGHMEPLVEWMVGDKWKQQSSSSDSTSSIIILPVVLEQGFSYNQQIDDAVTWLQERYHLDTPEHFVVRQSVVQERDCALSRMPSHSNVQQHAMAAKHSSSSSSSQQHRPHDSFLSARGKECAMEYFAMDYVILRELLDHDACKSQNCRNSIQSILKRRGVA